MATRPRIGELAAAARALFTGNPNFPSPFPYQTCNTQNAAANGIDWAYGNSAEVRFKNAAGTDDVRALTTNPNNQVMIAEALARGGYKQATWQVSDNGSISTSGFFLVNPGERYRVVSISWIHETQSSVAGTAYVEKTPTTVAPGAGTTLMSGTFNLHTIANATATFATLTATNTGDSDNPDLILNPGDQLTVVIAGTITSLAGVSCTVILAPLGLSCKTVSYYMKANADLVQGQRFFTANRAYGPVLNVSLRFSTKSSVAGLKLTVTKDTSTTAPGGGTSLLTDNTNAGPLVTGTANTTLTGTMLATAATIRFAAGDGLSLEFNGATLTALAGLVITVSINETASDRMEVPWFLDHVPGAADLVGIAAVTVFTADRDYEVLDIREWHNVAGVDGGTVTLLAGIASGTTAAASATTVVTAISTKTTARTTQVGTLAALGLRFLMRGDRIAIVPSGTFTTASGAQITIALRPC